MSPDLHHLSGAYSVDALENGERSEFEQHLAVCAACRSEVAELSATAHALGAFTEAAPPASLRTSVLAAVAQVRPLPPLVSDDVAEDAAADDTVTTRPADGEHDARHGATVVPLFRRPTAWIAAAAAAAVLAVGGVVWSPWSSDAPPALTAIQQVEQAGDATTVTKHEGDLTATVAYSRSLDRSAITVDGIPPAPEGSVYQLWYIGDAIRSAGFLDVPAGGVAEAALNGDLTGAAQVGITVEPAGGSPAPTTDPIVLVGVV